MDFVQIPSWATNPLSCLIFSRSRQLCNSLQNTKKSFVTGYFTLRTQIWLQFQKDSAKCCVLTGCDNWCNICSGGGQIRYSLKNSGHEYTFFNWKFANSVNEVLGWFGINLLASFQDITQNMFLILAKISHLADLQIYYFNLELVIELHWWHVKCLLSNMLLKLAS